MKTKLQLHLLLLTLLSLSGFAHGQETSQAYTAAVYGNATGPGGVGGFGSGGPGAAAVFADGNTRQTRDKGGCVKAMLYLGTPPATTAIPWSQLGDFTTAWGSWANHIAKWNGSSWSALGSGMNGGVLELTVSGNDVYAGGYFTTAGGKASAYTARAYLPALPTLSVLRSSEQVTVSWPTVDTAGFTLEQAGPLAAPAGWVTNPATVTDDGANKSVTIPATNNSQFFRLRRP